MTPKDDIHDQELLARYRRASDADTAGPSDTVRAAILAESLRVAERLAKQAPPPAFDASRPAANDSRWKIPAFGTIGAALLAALLFAPRQWENAPPAQVNTVSPASAPVTTQAQARTESVRQSPSDSNSLQEIVVTKAERRSSKSAGAPSLNPPVPAPTPPASVTQNYAPVSPSASPFADAPPAPAARLWTPNRSAQSAENSITGGVSSRADSALKPATLQSAVAQDDVAQAASLLDQGAVIDARDQAGRTPLMLAVTENRLEIVRLLLARGADPNAADNTGQTPLQQATKRNLREVAALLGQAGAH
jgi:hypothetical protein